MRESVEQPPDGRLHHGEAVFSISELDKLQMGDQHELSLAAFLAPRLEALYKELQQPDSKPDNFAHLCEIAADKLQRELRAAGFDASILEGDIEQSAHDWLVHQINLIKLPSH